MDEQSQTSDVTIDQGVAFGLNIGLWLMIAISIVEGYFRINSTVASELVIICGIAGAGSGGFGAALIRKIRLNKYLF